MNKYDWRDFTIDREDSLIGLGHLVSVLLAKFKKLPSKKIVLKLLTESICEKKQVNYAKEKDDLFHEAEILHEAYLNHIPNIIELHGFVEGALPTEIVSALQCPAKNEEQACAIVLEHFDGTNLASLLYSPKIFNLQDKLYILKEIALAIAEMHGKGFIHGDIKPQNVLVKLHDDRKVKLVDFGLSTIRENSINSDLGQSTVYNTNEFRGTKLYSAPEMLRATLNSSESPIAASRSTDMYSFGILTWELLSQQRPFEKDKSFPHSVVNENARPSLDILPSSTPGSLVNMIHRCWDADRLKRKTAIECFTLVRNEYERLKGGHFDIFFSHAWKNKPFLCHIYRWLCLQGFRVWYDMTDMGHDLQESMIKGVENSKVVLACCNQHFLSRENCLFEVKEARKRHKTVIVLVIEPNLPFLNSEDTVIKELFEFKDKLYINIGALATHPEWYEKESAPNPTLLQQLAVELTPLVNLLKSVDCAPSTTLADPNTTFRDRTNSEDSARLLTDLMFIPDSPYSDWSIESKHNKRIEVINTFKEEEKQFLQSLSEIIDQIITPLQRKDTVLKQRLLTEGRINACFNFLIEMHKNCSTLYTQLDSAREDKEIALAFLQFTNYQCFEQYALEYSHFIETMEANKNVLFTNVIGSLLLPTNRLDFTAHFSIPLEHYQKYLKNVQEFIWLTSDPSVELCEVFEDLYQKLQLKSNEIETILKEREELQEMNKLQKRFVGKPLLVKQSRKLLRESDIEYITFTQSGKMISQPCYAHLFNDLFVCSSLTNGTSQTGTFKIIEMIELKGAILEDGKLGRIGELNLARGESPSQFIHFILLTKEQKEDWKTVISEQIQQLKQVNNLLRTSIKRSTFTRLESSTFRIPGVDITKLGPRCLKIYKFLIQQKQFLEELKKINEALIQPLKIAKTGKIPFPLSRPTALSYSEKKRTSSSFDEPLSNFHTSSGHNSNQLLTFSQSERLRSNAIVSFLNAAEELQNFLSTWIDSLQNYCQNNKWSERIAIGGCFLSSDTTNYYEQLKAYSTGLPDILCLLNDSQYSLFQNHAEATLNLPPGALIDYLELPRTHLKTYQSFLIELQEITTTASDHFDSTLNGAISKFTTFYQEIIELMKLETNYQTLLAIQSSFMNIKHVIDDFHLPSLASIDRKLIKEDDLIKICRKGNKSFHFWLFNDYLLYGAPFRNGKYLLHHAFHLSKCSAVSKSPLEESEMKWIYSFEIHSAQKSFTAIASDAMKCEEWVAAINETADALRIEEQKRDVQEIAPVWTPDHQSSNCTECKKPFTLLRRRHHCRKCGALLCSDHLKHQEIIPHISKTQKLKICDNCVVGKSVEANYSESACATQEDFMREAFDVSLDEVIKK